MTEQPTSPPTGLPRGRWICTPDPVAAADAELQRVDGIAGAAHAELVQLQEQLAEAARVDVGSLADAIRHAPAGSTVPDPKPSVNVTKAKERIASLQARLDAAAIVQREARQALALAVEAAAPAWRAEVGRIVAERVNTAADLIAEAAVTLTEAQRAGGTYDWLRPLRDFEVRSENNSRDTLGLRRLAALAGQLTNDVAAAVPPPAPTAAVPRPAPTAAVPRPAPTAAVEGPARGGSGV